MNKSAANDLTNLSCFSRMVSLGILVPLLGACVTNTVSADGAPRDITNAVLSDRSASCAAFADTYTSSATDVQNADTYTGAVDITVNGGNCTISSNAVPNHDFNETGRFATAFREQTQSFTMTASPSAAARPTALSLQYDNAVFLNGVKLDLLAAGC